MSEVIVVTSGKGGVGKTTTTANIGYNLARLGKKVVLIDTDIGLCNLDIVMGMEHQSSYTLIDAAEGTCKYQQALVQNDNYENLFLMPSAQTADKNRINPEQMKKLIEELKNAFDYVILDCPAGVEQGFLNAVAGATRALVVVNPELSSIRDADHVVSILESRGIDNIQLVVNRLRPAMIKEGSMMSAEDVSDILGIELIGKVPDDTQLIIASNKGEILAENASMASQAYANISRRIVGEEVPFIELKAKGGLFSFFKRKGA